MAGKPSRRVRKSSVTSQGTVIAQEVVSEKSPDRAGAVSTHSSVTDIVTAMPDAGDGQEVVTNLVTDEAAASPDRAPAGEVMTNTVTTPVSKGLLRNLVTELLTAPAEEVEALRRILASPPAVQLAERRKVRRRTYAYYLPEELGEAIAERAKQEGVPPSAVAERLLTQAKAAGWL
ncbi:MAG: hypothetical protein IMX02_01715 [Limnochordaceae bacterium]|nr:hypothetical protein [Limnochordaceae bacterium]